MIEIENIDALRCEFDTCELVGVITSETKAIFNSIVDDIESEIEERFVELPIDADGEIIHIGDYMMTPNGGRDQVTDIILKRDGSWEIGSEVDAFEYCQADILRHIDRPPTLKELLITYGNALRNSGRGIEELADETVAIINEGWWDK